MLNSLSSINARLRFVASEMTLILSSAGVRLHSYNTWGEMEVQGVKGVKGGKLVLETCTSYPMGHATSTTMTLPPHTTTITEYC